MGLARCLVSAALGAALIGCTRPGVDDPDRVAASGMQHYAALGDVPALKRLLDGNRQLASSPHNGQTPLHTAARFGHVEAIRLLLSYGANVAAKDHMFGETPLHYAARYGQEAAVRTLVEEGKADVAAADNSGGTPLHHAAWEGHSGAVAALLRLAAQPNQAHPALGLTPLHKAAYRGHGQVVKVLLEAKADVNARTKDGMTPLGEAAAEGHEEVARLLLDRGARKDLLAAAGLGDAALVRELLDENPHLVNQTFPLFNHTLLHVAAKTGQREVAALLLDRKADIEKLAQGRTPLWLAVERGRIEVATLLLSRGAAVDATDGSGETPLYEAAKKNDVGMVRLLLGHKADVNYRKKTGGEDTPLHRAVDHASSNEVIELLVARGADLNARDREGRTPFALTRYNQDRDRLVEVLRKVGAKE